ncbi:MAG: class I SAM-dependent methyltransferase [Clostridiaceae bacterium]|nr:class I SAM-dependent methyltransferase [Clostridiaceae bacterium]
MASNAKNIIDRYSDGKREESRSSGNRTDYIMEYKYTKRILDRYISCESIVLEIGCGTGYYGIYLADKSLKYTGLDITPGNIKVFNEKIHSLALSNVTGVVGDATNMSEIDNESYDVVLAFGPIYHLPPDEQDLVFKESKRVCKHNGIIMFAYINKVGVYLGGCLNEPDKYPNNQKNKSLLREGIDDTRDHIYWFTMPEEIEATAQKHGLTIVENLGVDFIFTPEIYNLTSAKKESWEELADFMCASKSCTGFANHAVMVCRKG